jgi:endonuclease-3
VAQRAGAKPSAVEVNRGRRSAKPKLVKPEVARATFERLRAHHADAHCELDHKNAFELLVATVLSAQSTDVMVNKITPELFQRWPNAAAFAAADPAEVERALSRIGMYRQKTRNVIGLSKRLVEQHAGEVPRTLAELVELPGVGRKTANVVLGVAFGAPEGVVVDTHVQRLSQRLGFTKHTEPPEIEQDLMRIFPRDDWDPLAHVLIFHGRRKHRPKAAPRARLERHIASEGAQSDTRFGTCRDLRKTGTRRVIARGKAPPNSLRRREAARAAPTNKAGTPSSRTDRRSSAPAVRPRNEWGAGHPFELGDRRYGREPTARSRTPTDIDIHFH